MTHIEILEKIKYNYNLDEVDMLNFNNYTYLTTREYNCLINEYKRSGNKEVHDFLYANSFMIYRAIYHKRYSRCSYGLKTLNGWYDSDILQDFIFVFYSTLDKYKDIGESSSYGSYVNYHYRYYMTELLRTKYFQVLRVPQKESRKQETRKYKSELFENSAIDSSIEDSIIEMSDEKLSKLLEQVDVMIGRKYFTKDDFNMFLKYNGLTDNRREHTLEELREEYKINSTNRVFYRITKVVESCKKNFYFKKRRDLL